LQRGIQDWPLTSELEKKSRGESLEWSTETQAQVMEERMQKMQEYLLLTNLEAIAKARASAEAAWAAKVAEDARVEKLQARAEALARKQAAAQAVAELQQAKATQQPATPAGRNGEGPNQAKEPDASPRFPRQAANPFGLPNNQGTPGLVRPLYQPGPQSGTRPSPEQLQEMQLLMQKMSAQPAKPVAIEKRLEQLEGRLERIETLLQRLVQERAPEQD
jgi:hypothetical protein